MQPQPADPLISALFAALSDPVRRMFVQRLTVGEATVSELAALVDISLPAVSRHLRVLEEAGLVWRSKRGRATWCDLNPEGLDRAQDWLTDTRDAWAGRLDRLQTLLEEP